MKEILYPCFQRWPGTIWFYSDPHFGDAEMQDYRKNYISDDEQVKRINSKVGKDGTIVFLGDIGDIEFVRKIKGYKVLIMGNHDSGATNYKRVVNILEEEYFNPYCSIIKKQEDNKLFDEVYTGCLMIADNIILSHEPVDFKYALNIHGHDHAGSDFMQHVLKYYDADMPLDKMVDNYLATIKTDNLNKLNVCAEWINYTPINLQKVVKSGILHSIPDVHRDTIDTATLRKSKRNKR